MRQVFYKHNMGLVVEHQQLMYEAAVKEQGAGVGGEGEGPVTVDEVDIEYAADKSGSDTDSEMDMKTITLFFFFQRALTYEFKQLSEEKVEEYEVMAHKWNEEGPSDIEKKRYVTCHV
jgi:hypothetical protein